MDIHINSPSRWEFGLSSSCPRTVPTWLSTFAFLGFEMDVKPTPITSVDPRVQSLRITGKFPSFSRGISGDFPPFRRSVVPSFRHSVIPSFRHSVIPPFRSFRHSVIPSFHHWWFQILGSPVFSLYWEPTIIFIIELFSSYLDNRTNIISRHRLCNFQICI